MVKILDEEKAWDQFIELCVVDTESKEHADAVEAYLEEHPDDEDLEGLEGWVENDWQFGFNCWFEQAERDAAQEQAESQIN